MSSVAAKGQFPSVLGAAFPRLHPRVRLVHRGEPRVLHGTVTIRRGASPLARLLCALAMLPEDMENASLELRITSGVSCERWTRIFGGRRRLTSTLRARGTRLIERFGPLKFEFRLVESDGAIEWLLERVSVLGIPLRRWFAVVGHSGVRDGSYHFIADAGLCGIGRLIRYEGTVNVSQPWGLIRAA